MDRNELLNRLIELQHMGIDLTSLSIFNEHTDTSVEVNEQSATNQSLAE